MLRLPNEGPVVCNQYRSYRLTKLLSVIALVVIALSEILLSPGTPFTRAQSGKITVEGSRRFITLAQSNDDSWSLPTLLFETVAPNHIYIPIVVADQSGQVHVLWTFGEASPNSIYYTRLNGSAWSEPIDIQALVGANSPSATVDLKGVIHLLWARLPQLYYSQASVSEAISAHNWTKPTIIAETNQYAKIMTDLSGRLHIVYPGREESGLYYQTSGNGGSTWSSPVNISQTKSGSSAEHANLAITDNGILHVVWTEFQQPENFPPTGVYYSQSTDNGQSWANPLEIAGQGYTQINIAVTDNNTIHVAWNGMAGVQGRYHQWSRDDGQTWSEIIKLNTPGTGGSEGPPQLVVDSAGTLHLLTTDSGCVWYTLWQDQRWIEPTCLSQAEQIEAPAMTVSEGNILHVVYYNHNGSNWTLWYRARQTKAPAIQTSMFLPDAPTPTTLPTATPKSNLTPTPKPRIVKLPDEATVDSGFTSPGQPILVAILPVALIISSVLFIRFIQRGRG